MTVLLAITNQITAPIIEKNQSAAANESLKILFPDADGFETLDLSKYNNLPASIAEAHRETSNQGYALKLVFPSGYNPGDTILMCGVTADGTIKQIQYISTTDDRKAEAKAYGAQFVGKTIDTYNEVETIAQATVTTTTYRNAIKDALNAVAIFGGAEVDTRTDEEKFNDNLADALPAADAFVKQAIADENAAIDFIYAAENGAGYVYVIDETFIAVDAEGNVLTETPNSYYAAQAGTAAALAAAHTAVDITGKGINENVTSVQKNAQGNYVIEVNGLGFGWFGDPDYYQPAKNIPIKICTVVSPDGTMLECLTVSHQESGGYGAVCGEESYYGQFDGKTADTYQDVDIVGSPTYKITNKGYLNAIQRCFETVAILEGGAK